MLWKIIQVTIPATPFFSASLKLHFTCLLQSSQLLGNNYTEIYSCKRTHFSITLLLSVFWSSREWQLKLEFDHRNCCSISTVLQRNSRSVTSFLFIYKDSRRLNLTLGTQCKIYLTFGWADIWSICQINKCVVTKWG